MPLYAEVPESQLTSLLRKNIYMRNFFCVLQIAVLFPLFYASTSHAQTWNLVWSDEFNGTSLDANKWSFNPHEGYGNLEYFTNHTQNAYVENGHLVIKAIKENYTYGGKTYGYTSAELITRNKGDWLYGKFEVRAKLPYGKGLWPAIWMMPTDASYGNWPLSGEIDIMENLGKDLKKIYTTIHYGTANLSSAGTCTVNHGTVSDSFHVYSMYWRPDSFSFYLDDSLYWTLGKWNPDNAAFPAPFDKRFYFLLDVAVGEGAWTGAGNPDSNTVFPQEMDLDYVRVYQKGVASVRDRADGRVNHRKSGMSASGVFPGTAISVFDIQGRLVTTFSKGTTAKKRVFYTPGVYFVSVKGTTTISRIKVVP
jgi:Beta-glucanase/Beta-glucan synthetase